VQDHFKSVATAPHKTRDIFHHGPPSELRMARPAAGVTFAASECPNNLSEPEWIPFSRLLSAPKMTSPARPASTGRQIPALSQFHHSSRTNRAPPVSPGHRPGDSDKPTFLCPEWATPSEFCPFQDGRSCGAELPGRCSSLTSSSALGAQTQDMLRNGFNGSHCYRPPDHVPSLGTECLELNKICQAETVEGPDTILKSCRLFRATFGPTAAIRLWGIWCVAARKHVRPLHTDGFRRAPWRS